MFRTAICCVTLILALSVDAVAAPACDDAECPTATASKPLDIMKFMREQAASTRQAAIHTANPRPGKARPVAQVRHPVQRPVRHAVAARPKPAEMPVEAAASYAAQEPTVQVVASDELNDIDRAAPATVTSEETTGAATAAEPNVQLVVAEAFNDIDRKAEDRPPLSAAARVAEAHATTPQTSVTQTNISWLQWVLSAVGNLFGALATAMHHLVGLVTHTA